MSIEVIKGIRRELRKRVPLDRGEGFSTVADGHEVADIEVIVDMAKIACNYGTKAMANKSGRTRYMHGAVIVNVIRTRREP